MLRVIRKCQKNLFRKNNQFQTTKRKKILFKTQVQNFKYKKSNVKAIKNIFLLSIIQKNRVSLKKSMLKHQMTLKARIKSPR